MWWAAAHFKKEKTLSMKWCVKHGKSLEGITSKKKFFIFFTRNSLIIETFHGFNRSLVRFPWLFLFLRSQRRNKISLLTLRRTNFYICIFCFSFDALFHFNKYVTLSLEISWISYEWLHVNNVCVCMYGSSYAIMKWTQFCTREK